MAVFIVGMASSTPLDPYSMKKSATFNQIVMVKIRTFRPTPACDRANELQYEPRILGGSRILVVYEARSLAVLTTAVVYFTNYLLL